MEDQEKRVETQEGKQTKKIDGWFIVAIAFILLGIGAFFSLKEPMTKPYNYNTDDTFSGIEVPENVKHIGPFFYTEWQPMTDE